MPVIGWQPYVTVTGIPARTVSNNGSEGLVIKSSEFARKYPATSYFENNTKHLPWLPKKRLNITSQKGGFMVR